MIKIKFLLSIIGIFLLVGTLYSHDVSAKDNDSTNKMVTLDAYQNEAYKEIKDKNLKGVEAGKVIKEQYEQFISNLKKSDMKSSKDKEFLEHWDKMSNEQKEQLYNDMQDVELNNTVLETVENLEIGKTAILSNGTTVTKELQVNNLKPLAALAAATNDGTITVKISHLGINTYLYLDIFFEYSGTKVTKTTNAHHYHDNFNPGLFYTEDGNPIHSVSSGLAKGTAYWKITVLNIPGLSKTGKLVGRLDYQGLTYDSSYNE